MRTRLLTPVAAWRAASPASCRPRQEAASAHRRRRGGHAPAAECQLAPIACTQARVAVPPAGLPRPNPSSSARRSIPMTPGSSTEPRGTSQHDPLFGPRIEYGPLTKADKKISGSIQGAARGPPRLRIACCRRRTEARRFAFLLASGKGLSVKSDRTTLGRLGPAVGITAQAARPRLHLDQDEADGRQNSASTNASSVFGQPISSAVLCTHPRKTCG